jgi:lipopolysaccharide export system ATP-binding protein
VILEARGLKKFYYKKEVVKNVSLKIEPAQIVGLLGGNGAGKTTTFYMIMGLLKPDSGSIFLGDENITKYPLYKKAKMGIGYIPQETSVFEKLSVENNIIGVLQFQDLSKKEITEKANNLLEEFKIIHLRKQLALSLSGGEKRRLEIARALANNPKFILMDEPFAGVDPIAIDDIHQLLQTLVQKEISILITDHNAKEVLNIVEKIYLMNDGSILDKGTPAEITKNPLARKYYFGDHIK